MPPGRISTPLLSAAPPLRALLRLLPALLCLLLLLLLASPGAPPAAAHPLGPPPTALLTPDGRTVVIEWRAAPDDAMAIGVGLGLFDTEVLDAYLEAPTQAAPPAADEVALTRSRELRDYIGDRIGVVQEGVECPAALPVLEDFVHEGVVTAHHCPDTVTAVEVEITMLHDLHDSYRTFGVTTDQAAPPSVVMFSPRAPRHTIDFSDRAATPASATRAAAPGIAVLLLAGVTGALATVLVRRRRATP